jgi:hypothetical protein
MCLSCSSRGVYFINLELLVMDWIANFFDGSKRASSVGFCDFRRDTGGKYRRISGIVVSYNSD